jgi:dolichyl-phosphate-mannose--protein O-mannosyl transferase
MSPSFQKSLENNIYKNNDQIKPTGLVEKFMELNVRMYTANATLTAGHPYASKWLSWPFMIRPIYYWYETSAPTNTIPVGSSSRIYLIGNPIIWWASTIAILSILIGLFQGILKRNLPDKTSIFLGIAFLINLLPFIGIQRAMFLYHYMPALIFAIVGLVYLIDQYENKNKIFIVLLVLSTLSFIFFSPLTYGRPLSDKAYNIKVWLNSWR